MIVIKRCYTWYNVFVDNVLVLKHINKDDVDDLLKADINGEIKVEEKKNER